jgi:uncharacterized membrane protein YdcZ (DUF606 family)
MGALVSFAVGATSLAAASSVLYVLRPSLRPQLLPGLAYAFTPDNLWLCTGGLFGAFAVSIVYSGLCAAVMI